MHISVEEYLKIIYFEYMDFRRPGLLDLVAKSSKPGRLMASCLMNSMIERQVNIEESRSGRFNHSLE